MAMIPALRPCEPGFEPPGAPGSNEIRCCCKTSRGAMGSRKSFRKGYTCCKILQCGAQSVVRYCKFGIPGLKVLQGSVMWAFGEPKVLEGIAIGAFGGPEVLEGIAIWTP